MSDEMQLVFLHGPAASGKLTTARELERITGYPVFHNHLVVDALTTVFPFGTAPFIRLRERWWLDVFSEAAAAGRSLIFTFAPEPTVQPGFPARVRRAVEGAGGRTRFVRLAVSEAEQEARIGSADRAEFHKLTDVALLRRLRLTGGQAEEPPVDLEIDTDASGPRESAERIAAAFALHPQQRLARYPAVAADPEPGAAVTRRAP
jgi:hypothetical protein